MKRRLGLAILAPLVAAGCRAAPPLPRHFVESDFGIVRAEDPDVARAWSLVLDDAWRGLAPQLAGLRERPVDLRVVARLADANAHGLTFEERVEVLDATPPESRLFVVAHELVHWLGDDTWQRLPHVVQEGLGDWAAMRVDPAQGTRRRAEHALFVATMAGGGLALAELDAGLAAPRVRRWRLRAEVDAGAMPPLASVLDLSDEELVDVQAGAGAVAIYAVGWLYVERIGVDRLRLLCRRAAREDRERVPAGWLHRAAGFDRYEPAAWAAAARAVLGPAERAYLLEEASAAVDARAR